VKENKKNKAPGYYEGVEENREKKKYVKMDKKGEK